MKIPLSRPALVGNEREYVNDCLDRNELSSVGSYVGRLEEAFAKFCGTKHAIACSSGTAGLHLSLLACGVKHSDRVIVPTLSYIATANAVKYVGALPVFCDAHPVTWCIDPEEALRKVIRLTSEKYRVPAIIPVHLYGIPADMSYLREMASRYGLFAIEDACEAHGAKVREHMVGSLGDLGVFSFYGNKMLTCGEGGIVTTDSDELAKRVRLFRGQGVPSGRGNYNHEVVGYNYRLTNIQAAIALAQLESYSFQAQERRKIVQTYLENLPQEYSFQRSSIRDIPADWLFTVLVPDDMDRDVLRARLAEQGIETRPAFPSIHTLPMYPHGGEFPISEKVSSQGLSLPTWVGMTVEDVKYVTSALRIGVAAV